MLDTNDYGAVPPQQPLPPKRPFWLPEVPHLIILGMTVAGAGYVAMTRQPIAYYWAALGIVICAISIYLGWSDAKVARRRWRLVWTQALHWLAFLAAISLLFLPSVQANANADVTSLMVLILVALGTFVAGVHTTSWRMCANGVVMAVFVPVIAWLDQSALLMTLGAVVIIAVAGLVLAGRLRG